jgi:hypothetical protein
MQTITTIGFDIAKSVFQVHGVDAAGEVVIRRQLKRRHVLAFFQIQDLLKGKKPNRESVLEPTTPRASAVPPAGKPRPETGCLEPIAVLKSIGRGPWL